jgi:hypothetical protein
MDKGQLAQDLRQRQYQVSFVERSMVDALSDDDIIDSYVTCSQCGMKQVRGRSLEIAIERAKSAAHFLELCNELADARYKSLHQPQPLTRSARKRVIKRAWDRKRR